MTRGLHCQTCQRVNPHFTVTYHRGRNITPLYICRDCRREEVELARLEAERDMEEWPYEAADPKEG